MAWREQTAAAPPRAHASERYWAKALPGFGDPAARLVVVGLAPAAHGGNRTGRMFTGDRSGEFLFAALHRAGYANQPTSTAADDGLELAGAYVTAAARCAPPDNKPLPSELAACAPYLADELAALGSHRVLLALGAIAYDALRRLAPVAGLVVGRPARFSHGLEIELSDGRRLLCSYHPSQRNVFTGLLTAEMFDAVLARARALGG